MKAVTLLEYGGQLMFEDVPTPAIARDEILVKVKSTAVNHLDLVKASGTARGSQDEETVAARTSESDAADSGTAPARARSSDSDSRPRS